MTENVRDFMPIHQSVLARGEQHAGILFTSPRKYPRRTEAIGPLIAALAEFLDSHSSGTMAGDFAWL